MLIDVLLGQEVQNTCIGRVVRFQPAACRGTIDPKLLYYNVLPGTGTTPVNCDFVPGQLPGNTYTFTTTGTFTVSELTNSSMAGGTGTVYVRTFQIGGGIVPTFQLMPCSNGTVLVTLANSGYDQYFAQVNNGPTVGPLTTSGPITLPAPAGSTVTIIGRYLGTGFLCANQSIQTVPVLATPQTPVLSRLTVQTLLPIITLGVDAAGLPAGYRYDLQRAAASSPGNFRRVLAFAGAGSTPITLTNAQAGLYRIGRRDVCGTDSTFSAPVPTIQLAGTSANNVNSLSWQTAGPVVGYTLLRNGTALTTLPPSATAYADAAVTCGTSYTYELQASVAGSAQSISNDVVVQAVSTLPPATPLLNASFDLAGRLTLTATPAGGAALPTGGQLLYSRQGGPGALDFAALPTATDTLRDPAALAPLLAAPPCYTLRLQDVCGNASAPTPPTCPSLLAVAAADPDGLTAQLNWSAFRGPGSPAAGASYRVLTLAPDGTVLATSAATTGLSYFDPTPPTDRQVLRYRIEASGAGLPAGTVSYSNVATLVRQPRLVVPDAFTPNGDGLNDVLALKGRYLNNFSFVVIDKNGQEAFRATDRTQTWDGTIRGHAPVNGAYVWHLTLRDEVGQNFSQTGTVTILK
ncbi:hypothetical protein A0257_20075 [Hymenobacter psoromatis]|nr:hypothetical protein A0257_20075 [Hymenobacter psoromatis]